MDIQHVETPSRVESIQQATESWNKRPSNKISRAKRFSYFLRKTIARSQSATTINKSNITKKSASGMKSVTAKKTSTTTKSALAQTRKKTSNSSIPKIANGLIKNQGIRKCKSKDSTKVAKKIVTRRARLEVESSSHVSQLPELDIQQVETPLIVESTQLATESWNKRPSNKIPRTKHSSYFSRKTIAKVRYNY